MGLPQLFKNIQIDLPSKTLLYGKCKNQSKIHDSKKLKMLHVASLHHENTKQEQSGGDSPGSKRGRTQTESSECGRDLSNTRNPNTQ